MPTLLKFIPFERSLFSLTRIIEREAVFLFAVIAGAALRFYQLSGQILFGDEWHAIHAAANNGYLHIDQEKVRCSLYIKPPFDISDKTEGLFWQLCEILANMVRKDHARSPFPGVLSDIRKPRLSSPIFQVQDCHTEQGSRTGFIHI